MGKSVIMRSKLLFLFHFYFFFIILSGLEKEKQQRKESERENEIKDFFTNFLFFHFHFLVFSFSFSCVWWRSYARSRARHQPFFKNGHKKRMMPGSAKEERKRKDASKHFLQIFDLLLAFTFHFSSLLSDHNGHHWIWAQSFPLSFSFGIAWPLGWSSITIPKTENEGKLSIAQIL